MALLFPTSEQQFADHTAYLTDADFAELKARVAAMPPINWLQYDDEEPDDGDMEDMLAEHSTYRAVNGSVL